MTALENWSEDKSGVYHLTCSGVTTWHGFTQAIIEEYASIQKLRHWPALNVKNVSPITSAEYPTPATRPTNSKLNCDSLCETFDLNLPEWNLALKQVMLDGQY